MSKIQLSPYVNFQGRAREAMEFYHKVLGGKLDLQTGPGDSIRHARLEADGVLIIASDGHPDYPAKVGDNMAIALGGSDKDRLTKIFNDLADGGKVQMPLAKQPWGAEVGWLKDKLGINWTVNIDADRAATLR
jgi:PhnB protein